MDRGRLTHWVGLGAALVAAGAAFVPMFDWYEGGIDSWSPAIRITFARVVLMHLQHRMEHFEGIVLFVLPSLAFVVALAVDRAHRGVHRVLAIGTLVIGVLELVLALVESRYGTVYDAVEGFLGVHGMMPHDRFVPHALTLVFGGAVWTVAVLASSRAKLEKLEN